ncbi:MAG: type I-U CRISPR-associated protein Csx17 [Pseudomonadota bacterium]
MTIHVHRLAGCAPEPLAHYLKALGVLRLVSEQADRDARGWWKDECFHLATGLDAESTVRFFLDTYQPTPLVAPWNKGSGFYQPGQGIAAFETSGAARFDLIRQGIAAARDLLHEIAEADAAVRRIKDETKVRGLSAADREKLRADSSYKRRLADAERRFQSLKAELVPRCRFLWRGRHADWLAAAIVIDDDGKPAYPAMLGTGGNDGRLDFSNSFFQRLRDLFEVDGNGGAKPGAKACIELALWGRATCALSQGLAIGQYLPGGAGGANATAGPEGESLLNPADFVLAMEGCLLFKAGVGKRLDLRDRGKACAPFALPPHAAAYASASQSDESPRGEQWMPLWGAPASVSELRHLLAEGRSRLGSRPVLEPIHFARAVASLGVARGIVAFQRFGYIERNGQSNLAVPLGRFRVQERALPHISLLDDLDTWLARVKRAARGEKASTRLVLSERAVADALFAVVQHPDEPLRWQRVLLALASVEAVLASGSGFEAGPIPTLNPGWISAADDGSPESRLAIVFALQGAPVRGGGGGDLPVDPVRRHWLPLSPNGRVFDTRKEGQQKRLVRGPSLVIAGRDAVQDALALVQRRLVEGARAGRRQLGLVPAPGASAFPADLARLVAGEVDLERTLGLARAIAAIDRHDRHDRHDRLVATRRQVHVAPCLDIWPDDAWCAIRLATLAWPFENHRELGCDPAIVRRLAAGDAPGAIDIALRRLRAAGIVASLRGGYASPERGRLWAAALAFPIDRRTARRMARRLCPSFLSQGDQP